MHDSRPGRRVAIVAGVRTPFAKSGTVFRDVSATALARHAARELLYRSELDGREIDEVIFGQVVPSVRAPNVAREVSLLPQLLPSVPAYTLNRACASAAQAITNAADQIALGHADVGARRRRRIAVRHSRSSTRAASARSWSRRARPRASAAGWPPSRRIRPRDLVPVTPAIAEPSHRRDDGPVGREDGEGERHHPRGAGPSSRCMSHQRAAAATADGRLAAEIAPWFGGRGDGRDRSTGDNGIRADTSLEALAAAQAGVRPALRHGHRRATRRRSPTAPPRCCSWPRRRPRRWATSRSPTSGATRSPRWIRAGSSSWARCTRCPWRWSAPGIAWSDIDLVEIHEAFAAQVLCNVQAWGSQAWAERLGLAGPGGRGRLGHAST